MIAMRKVMVVALAGALACGAFAQGLAGIYVAGRSVADQGIRLRPWGSGTIAESDETAFQGTTSIRIFTRNFFQGGSLILERPLDLSGAFGDKNNLLLVTLRLPQAGEVITPGGGAAGGGGGMATGGLAGATGTGGGGGGGASQVDTGGEDVPTGRQTGGTRGQTTQAALPIEPMRVMRLVVRTTDGLLSEAYVPVTTSGPGERGWRQVGIPLQAIRGFERTNKQIQEITLSGDSTATFFVGEMVVQNDATPLQADVSPTELNLALGDEVELRAFGFGGASILRFTWDFDDSDGLQEEAEGQVIRYRFRRPGEFKVTVTVSDAYGLKEPARASLRVTVNP